MRTLSDRSLKNLKQCHPDLLRVCESAIQDFDFTVICGYRGEKEQNEAFAQKKSKLKFPESKHNKSPSQAFDAMPTKTGFNDFCQFEAMAKVILEHAAKLGIKIRWGADWNMNGSSKDEKFIDAPHFELP